LGLKPLEVSSDKPVNSTNKEKSNNNDDKKTYIDKDTNQEFEHAPAKNLTEIREQKEMRQKLQEIRERRQLANKFNKGIADQDDNDDDETKKESSTEAWVRKLKEKEEAKKKAKLLEEMDEQFASNNNNDDDTIKNKTKEYSINQLKGLKVEHDESLIKEGQDIILTLKDRYILKGTGDNQDVDDDEEADVLVNVNIMDDERANKNVENKKNKPGYIAYDDFDENGMVTFNNFYFFFKFQYKNN
jgi:U4/U6.U5 tri-snRNP-associated protein 1